MNLKFIQTVIEPQDSISRVRSITFAPNGHKTAVIKSDRVIYLFDDKGNEKDKFPTKPIETQYGKQSYQVQSIAFSPDSSKLAVAQTDNIVFVYRLGESWNEKKVICNRFTQPSGTNIVAWPEENKLIIGLANGRVRNASVASNKCSTLYKTDSFTTSIGVHPNKKSFVSGHIDGSVILYSFESRVQTKLLVHSTPPYCLLLTNFGILIGGSDRRLVSYTEQGRLLQQYDYNKDTEEKEFTTAILDPSGLNAVFGSFNKLRLMSWNARRGAWDEGSILEIKNMYTVTALAWRPDGSSIMCGTLLGAAIAVDCCLRRTLLKGQFQTTFVSPSQVIVRDINSDRQCSLRSIKGLNISDIRILGRENRIVIAYTPNTLILADMETDKFSEILWNSGGHEKFYVDSENVCMIVNAGEISLVEYGKHEIVGWIRTERMSPHLISVRLGEQKRRRQSLLRRVAYMLDVHTISIINLDNQQVVSQINHGSVIDWLELNETAEKCLFRDLRSGLFLHDIYADRTYTLINFCSYVQWVPQSDVIVAQSNEQLCVWYNSDNAEQIVQIPILGDVETVLRDENRTEVIVQENNAKVAYELDNALIEFATAIEDRDLNRALIFLENNEERPDVAPMWKQMSQVAIEEGQLIIAQRCYAALNDISKVRFVEDTITLMEEEGESYKVKARMALMKKQLKEAEHIYMSNNANEETLNMYQTLHKWGTAMELAKAINYADTDGLKVKYLRYLHETNQDEKVAEMKMEEGRLTEAVELYLQSNRPVQAANLIIDNSNLSDEDALIRRVIEALQKQKIYNKAGELWEMSRNYDQALENYEKGNDYSKAVNIARIHFPEKVTVLEEEWGDHLTNNGDHSAAVSHYVESGKLEKAVGASIKAKEWQKAQDIINSLDRDSSTVKEHYSEIAKHFESQGQYDKAEQFYLNADMIKQTVEMYHKAGRWTDAYNTAIEMIGTDEARVLYYEKAKDLEEQEQYNQAEELYVAVGEPNDAIIMYKRLNRLDDMLRLVQRFHPEEVGDTYKRLADDLRASGEFRAAEEQYLKEGDWKAAMTMYKDEGQWQEAYRVAKTHGGDVAPKQVIYLWAQSLGGEPAVRLLERYNVLDEAITIGIERDDFDFAYDVCRIGATQRLPEVQLKNASYLERNGEYRKAEEFYIQGGKAKEAVDMYIETKMFTDAERVANEHVPGMSNEVFLHRAKASLLEKDSATAESYLLRADRADIILDYYKSADMWEDALRIAKEYVPDMLAEVEQEYEDVQLRSGARGAQSFLVRAQEFELDEEYEKAIENYLKVDAPLTDDTKLIAQAYQKAGQLVIRFTSGDRQDDYVEQICSKLMDLNLYVPASEIYLAVNQHEQAVTALILGNEWSRAKKIAEELVPYKVEEVDRHYKEYLKKQGRVGDLIDVDVLSAIDVLVEQGNWDRALATAVQQNHPQLLEKYITMYVAELVKDTNIIEAMKVFEKYGTPLNTFNTYKMLIDMILNQRSPSYEHLSSLRNTLLSLNTNINKNKNDVDPRYAEVFNKYLIITHYYTLIAVFDAINSQDTQRLVQKLKVSLLRYLDLVQPDKLLYEAGMACKEVKGYENMTFTLFNQYIDIVNAIDENDPSEVDSEIFQGTDVPLQFPLPQQPYITGDEHEEVNEWVLGMSVDKKVEKELKQDNRGCYEASTVDNDGNVYPACVISGYPVISNPKTLGNEKVADQSAWHQFVTLIRTNPSEDLFDIQNFLSKWTETNISLTY